MITWLTAFIDLPASSFDEGTRFWMTVTRSTRSATRGVHAEFATLVPHDGDPYLRVQRVEAGPAHLHLDVHTDDRSGLRRLALGLGATEHPHGEPGLISPGGFPFCIVADRGEATRPTPVREAAGRSLVDQLALDIPATAFDREAAFWVDLLGYERRQGNRPELEVLVRPPAMPLRILLQRLGDDDPRTEVEGHLDLATGTDRQALLDVHRDLGAELERVESHWLTLRDPAGLAYCLTARDPDTGLVS